MDRRAIPVSKTGGTFTGLGIETPALLHLSDDNDEKGRTVYSNAGRLVSTASRIGDTPKKPGHGSDPVANGPTRRCRYQRKPIWRGASTVLKAEGSLWGVGFKSSGFRHGSVAEWLKAPAC